MNVTAPMMEKERWSCSFLTREPSFQPHLSNQDISSSNFDADSSNNTHLGNILCVFDIRQQKYFMASQPLTRVFIFFQKGHRRCI